LVSWIRATFGDWKDAVRYFRRASYEQEIALGIYFQKSEVAVRAMLEEPNCISMQRRAATSIPSAFSNPDLGRRGLGQRHPMPIFEEGPRTGSNLAARAATAETRRRLVIVALTLEQHRTRHGSYPQDLAQSDPAIPAPA